MRPVDGHILLAYGLPPSAVRADGGDALSVHADGDVAVLAGDEGDGELVFAAVGGIDITPLQVVLLATAQPSGLEACRAEGGGLIDAGFLRLVVLQLLIVADVGRLRLIVSTL